MRNFIGNNINAIRIHKGFSQEKMAEIAGVSQTTISAWECGVSVPRRSNVLKIMDAIPGLTFDDIMSDDKGFAKKVLSVNGIMEARPSRSHYLPIVGRIAAGDAREAIEQTDQYYPIADEFYEGNEDSVWLVLSGNSMNKYFADGTLLLVNRRMEVLNGDIAVTFVNGDDATVKRVFFDGDKIILRPESYDPEYQDRVIDRSDPDAPGVYFFGKVMTYTAPPGWRP